ncbi:MAG: glutaredoxin 3 [Cellvibrionales bacterium]|nr:MAG: glutaredoxin 3 [Cellvibrionales bacterium]
MDASELARGHSVSALISDSTSPVKIFTTQFCPYCVAARRLLEQLGIDFEDVAVDGDAEMRREITQASGQHTVPQIWIGERHVGGYTELAGLHQQGGLLPLLND